MVGWVGVGWAEKLFVACKEVHDIIGQHRRKRLRPPFQEWDRMMLK